MDDKLSSGRGRDKYVRNTLRNKNLQTREEFRDLMKKRFDGQERMYGLIMKSYWHVTQVHRARHRSTRNRSDDTRETAKREAPVSVLWLSTFDDLPSDDKEEDVDVPATTSAAEKEPIKVPAPTSAAKKEATKFIAL